MKKNAKVTESQLSKFCKTGHEPYKGFYRDKAQELMKIIDNDIVDSIIKQAKYASKKVF